MRDIFSESEHGRSPAFELDRPLKRGRAAVLQDTLSFKHRRRPSTTFKITLPLFNQLPPHSLRCRRTESNLLFEANDICNGRKRLPAPRRVIRLSSHHRLIDLYLQTTIAQLYSSARPFNRHHGVYERTPSSPQTLTPSPPLKQPTDRSQIFRILGDVSHTLSKCILIYSIHSNSSAEGVSLITQSLYCLVFITRYLDLFQIYSWWNFVLKIFYILSSLYIIFLMMRIYARTREREKAWKFGGACLIGSALLAPLVMLIFRKKYEWGVIEVRIIYPPLHPTSPTSAASVLQ